MNQAVSHPFVSIIYAVKIFIIRADQECINLVSHLRANREALNSTKEEVEQEKWEPRSSC